MHVQSLPHGRRDAGGNGTYHSAGKANVEVAQGDAVGDAVAFDFGCAAYVEFHQRAHAAEAVGVDEGAGGGERYLCAGGILESCAFNGGNGVGLAVVDESGWNGYHAGMGVWVMPA